MASSRPAPESRRRGPGASSRVPALVFLLAMTGFIVYGSLFPFDFSSEPLPLESFFSQYQLFDNRSDAIDNFLLFVPFGVALHASLRAATARVLGAILAVLVLAIGIQLVQLYLPSRVASLSDAFWNTAGMVAGMLVAGRVRRALRARLAERERGRDYFLACLLLLWFFYESFPFVPTLDIGLLRAHIKPFVYAPPFEAMRLVQHALAAALAGVAVMRLGWLRRPALGVLALGALAMLLEVCVAYGSLRRETVLGMALGWGAGYLLVRHARGHSHDAALLLALAAFLITVFTPYRGQAADGGFTFTPFSHLMWNGVLNEISPAAFEALAIGAMLWAGMAGPRRFRERPLRWCALVLGLLAALEIVRMKVVGLHGDSTALTMALVLAPAAMSMRLRGDADADADADADPVAAAPPDGRRGALLQLGAAAVVLTLGMWLLVHLPGVPYNLAKLFGQHAVFGAAVFSLALLWLGAGPWLAVRAALALDARRRHGTLWMPLLLLGVALLSFMLVDLATPEIMLDKIIGAPDLYRRVVSDNYWGAEWAARMARWPGELVRPFERVLRYLALYAVFMIPLAVALHALPGRDRRARLLLNALWLLPFWILAKYVVLDWAVTDNLQELVAEGGVPCLAAVAALLAANAAAVAASAGQARRWPALALATLLMLGASWWLLGQGIETVVINNGRMFSGLQFLLAENRGAGLGEWALAARWGALYLAAVAVVAAGVLLTAPLWPAAPAPARR